MCNVKIIVVDNGSTDDSVSILRENYESIILLTTSRNLGFAGGMNVGIRYALDQSFDYLVLLNNDVVINDSNLFQKLMRILESSKCNAAASPEIKTADDSIWFNKGKIDWRRGITKHDNVRNCVDIIDNDYMPFCCCMMKAETIKKCGLLPEKYFLYYEDADYCCRIRREGLRIVTDTSTSITHKVSSSSSGPHQPTPSYYITRNKILFLKYNSESAKRFFSLYLLFFVITRIIHRLSIKNPQSAAAILYGLVHGAKGISGKGPYP